MLGVENVNSLPPHPVRHPFRFIVLLVLLDVVLSCVFIWLAVVVHDRGTLPIDRRGLSEVQGNIGSHSIFTARVVAIVGSEWIVDSIAVAISIGLFLRKR